MASRKPTKFTFKKEPRATGLASVANPTPNTAVKLAGREVGYISAPYALSPDNKFRVRLSIKDEVQQQGWKWITLAVNFDSEPAARLHLNNRFTNLVQQFEFHEIDYT